MESERKNNYFRERRRPSKNSVHDFRGNKSVILFVTVNAARRQPVFASPDAVDCIVSVWKSASNWIVGQYVIMPDHIHFFCAPGTWPPADFHRWMAYWKSCVARKFPVPHTLPLWQRECWDVQMRTSEIYREKWAYIRANPVRKNLVENMDDWPFQGCLNPLAWHDT